MAEEMMNEEMAPTKEPMTGMAAPEESMPMEESAPETSFDMETLMGNFMDLDEDRRQIAFRLMQTPAAEVLDEILGEPVIARLNAQLGEGISMGEEAPAEEPMPAEPEDTEGLMGPTE